MDDDDDDDDLFDDFEAANDDEQLKGLSISSNLLSDIGCSTESTIHQGDADEGRITWEAPAFHGLANSNAVKDSTGSHWYREEAEEELWNELLATDNDNSGDASCVHLSENLQGLFAAPALLGVQDVSNHSHTSALSNTLLHADNVVAFVPSSNSWVLGLQHKLFGSGALCAVASSTSSMPTDTGGEPI